jgi:hypothetical protein
LPVVLYDCEIWSLTLREEFRLRVFENRILRTIFGPKTDEVIGGGEDYITMSFMLTKYHSGRQVKKTGMGRTCGTYGGEERCIQGFSGET